MKKKKRKLKKLKKIIKKQFNYLKSFKENNIELHIILKDYVSILIKYSIMEYFKYYTPESDVCFFYRAWLNLLINMRMNKKDFMGQIYEFGDFCLKSLKYHDDFIETNINLYYTYLSILGLLFEILRTCFIFKLEILKFLKLKLSDIQEDNLLMFLPFKLPFTEKFSCKLYQKKTINTIKFLKYLVFVYSQYIIIK